MPCRCRAAVAAILLTCSVWAPSAARAADPPPTPRVLTAGLALGWQGQEDAFGRFLDPAIGLTGGYGGAMLGEVLLSTGVQTGDTAMRDAGYRALDIRVSQPLSGPFDRLAIAEAYLWADGHLNGDPSWMERRAVWARWLQGACTATRGGHCGRSGRRSRAYLGNLSLVEAVGNLTLLATGLESSAGKLSDRIRLREQVSWLLRETVPLHTGSGVRRAGAPAGSAGVLSDPSSSPLAYHALSVMLLGRAVALLGPSTPRAARAAWLRAARGLALLQAPDGDVTYLGRGQEQVWAYAVTALAGIDAAAAVGGHWHAMFLAMAGRALLALPARYLLPSGQLALVPRQRAGDATLNLGLDHYAGAVTYNGLAAWALLHASERPTSLPLSPAIPADHDGVTIDDAQTGLLAVTHGSLWYALHLRVTHPTDPRYGFGVLALMRNGVRLLPDRPLTAYSGSGGPSLCRHAVCHAPGAAAPRVLPGGVVDALGGWGGIPEATRFRWSPTASGVSLRFTLPAKAEVRFAVWAPEGAPVRRLPGGIQAGTVRYRASAPVRVAARGTAASASDARLTRYVLTVSAARRPRVLTWAVTSPAG